MTQRSNSFDFSTYITLLFFVDFLILHKHIVFPILECYSFDVRGVGLMGSPASLGAEECVVTISFLQFWLHYI